MADQPRDAKGQFAAASEKANAEEPRIKARMKELGKRGAIGSDAHVRIAELHEDAHKLAVVANMPKEAEHHADKAKEHTRASLGHFKQPDMSRIESHHETVKRAKADNKLRTWAKTRQGKKPSS